MTSASASAASAVRAHGVAGARYAGSSRPGVSSRIIWASSVGADADDAVARGLRLWADDAELFADDAIEERGFAGVRLSDDGDDSGARHRRKHSGAGVAMRRKRRTPAAVQIRAPRWAGACKEVPATAYSPALSRAEYHRRCRA